MAGALKVTFTPDRLTLGPGESAELEVTIQNASRVVEHFGTTVVGLPRDDLFSAEPAVMKLRPMETGTVRLRVSVPDHGGMVAGAYALGVLVRSPYQREVSRCEELPLDVRPAPGLALGVQPEIVTGGKNGLYVLNLANEGNTPLAVALAGRDQENRVGFEFRPREVYLEPGTSTGAELVVRADPPLTGQETRRALTLRAHAGDVEAERPVTFLQRPRIAGGLLRVATVAAGVAVLAGAALGGALLIRSGKETPAQVAPMGQPAAPGASSAPGGSAAPSSPAASSSSAAQPSSSPPPAQSSAPPSSAASTATPSGARLVDFSRLPDGSPPGNRIISGDLYAAKGVKLSADTQNAPTGCKDATAVALRTAGSFGSFLTSSGQAGADVCNTDPVRVDFTAPAHWVRVSFTGSPATTSYTMTAQLDDGSTQQVAATVQAGNVVFEAPAGTSVASVTFGHTNPDPTAKEFTAIKALSYTPAQ
ncbi:hypothetical protein DMA12_44640 [Amycolatopsis balhimycina DSM 5908]|uniref:Hydrolytic protein n=1 Tax=Amycolatopsis balhimycina DSM 5908 TaxID=1081091 RepID=A0A428VWV6_AMYBA|nr:hypothetical protein [Amycolatopsis balhimycina]RSM35340.1 hypothetical protein DMA12_44640 [Amycolatopsis balhimycina DSM 5908]